MEIKLTSEQKEKLTPEVLKVLERINVTIKENKKEIPSLIKYLTVAKTCRLCRTQTTAFFSMFKSKGGLISKPCIKIEESLPHDVQEVFVKECFQCFNRERLVKLNQNELINFVLRVKGK